MCNLLRICLINSGLWLCELWQFMCSGLAELAERVARGVVEPVCALALSDDSRLAPRRVVGEWPSLKQAIAPPRARCLRALRQRVFERHKRYAVSPAPPRARGARAAAQSMSGLSENKSPLKEKQPIRAAANRLFLSSRAFCGLSLNTMPFIEDRTELPSRRAGGAAGTPNEGWGQD